MKSRFFLSVVLSCFSTWLVAQEPAIQNPAFYEWNRLPITSTFWQHGDSAFYAPSMPASEQAADYQVLSGGKEDHWSFHYCSSKEEWTNDFENPNFDDSQWKTIPVPGQWAMYSSQGPAAKADSLPDYGYPQYLNWSYPFKPRRGKVPDEAPVGEYRHTFRVTMDNTQENDRFILRIGAVSSCYHLWLNGEYIGYAEDSKLPSEWDVTSYLSQGENTLAMRVHAWCSGTYLEDQDMWRMGGITRPVVLYRQPAVSITDWALHPTLDSTLQNGKYKGYVEVKNTLGRAVSAQINLVFSDTATIAESRKSLALTIPAGEVVQVPVAGTVPKVSPWSHETPILYLAEAVLKVEGKPAHSIAIPTGFRKVEVKDGKLFINGELAELRGVNRHEHHPTEGQVVGMGSRADAQWLFNDLLAIRSSGFNAVRTAHYPNHEQFYQFCNMLGLYVIDEANVESHWYMMFRPFNNLMHEKDFKEATISRVLRMYKRDRNHPSVIIWSPGNENGTGPTMVAVYDTLKALDPTRPVFNERHFFLDGRLPKHSDINGNMYAPISKVKKLLKKDKDKPFIWIEYAHAMGNSTGNFSDLWQFIRSEERVQGGFIWDWRDQGLETYDDSTGQLYYAYGGHFEPEGVKHDGNFCANGMVGSNGEIKPGLIEAMVVQMDSIPQDDTDLMIPDILPSPGPKPRLKVNREEQRVVVTGRAFSVVFSNEGRLLYATDYQGDTLVQAFGLNFWRAPTDNDFGNGMPKRCKSWRKATLEQPFTGIENIVESQEHIRLVAVARPNKRSKVVLHYTIKPEGIITVEVDASLKSRSEIPRIGTYWVLPENKTGEEVWYQCRGPHENYVDRKASAALNRAGYGLRPVDNAADYPYIRPQEYGNRCDCRALQTGNYTLRSDSLFSFSAWKHSLWAIEEYPNKEGLRPIDIPFGKDLWLNVDYGQMGLGGDNSWGRKPYDKYLLKSGDYTYSYTIQLFRSEMVEDNPNQ